MSVLTATGVSQSYGFVDVFANISVSLAHEDKVGLIGPNGTGKTTLLRILARAEAPASGSVHLAKGKRIGYLPQEAMDAFATSHDTVYAEMLSVFNVLHEIENKMRALEAQMNHGMTDALAHEYSELQEQFERRGGYDHERRIEQTLQGLGFARPKENKEIGDSRLDRLHASWDTPIAHLSGGQKTRALLAKILLENPDVLIMDEPTNHLDIEAIEWLEKMLTDWDGALIVVSHDRLFLDHVVNKIWEIEKRTFRTDKYDDRIWEMMRTHVETYRGNYSDYLRQREERFQRSLFVFNQEKDRLDKEMAYIKANNPGEPSVQSMGKLKRLTRDVLVIERIGAEALINNSWSENKVIMGYKPTPFGVEEAEKRVARLPAPTRPQKVNLALTPAKRSGEIVLRTRGLVVGYGKRTEDAGQKTKDHRLPSPDKAPTKKQPETVLRPSSSVSSVVSSALFTSPDLELRWQERAALLGPNGSGKTTFLKTALGGLSPLGGSAELGASLIVGYFAQAHDQLDPKSTIIDTLRERGEGFGKRLSEADARYFLAQFLFRQDDVFKPVGGLSGGERARLALAILSLQGANFLVLDEPTNHLDINAQEVLEEALMQFTGTVLLVSHDRYLVNKLAQQIWRIEDGELKVYRGTYEEWLREKLRIENSDLKKGGREATNVKREASSVKQPALSGDALSRPKGETSISNLQSSVSPISPVPQTLTPNANALSKNAERKRQERVKAIETEIADTETHLLSLGKEIETAGTKGQTSKVRELSEDYASAQRALDALWAELGELV